MQGGIIFKWFVDKSTIAPTLLPTPSPPRFDAGEPMDTVSMINPMPTPTNSTYTMGGGCQHGRNCAGIGPVVYPLPRPLAEVRDKITGNSTPTKSIYTMGTPCDNPNGDCSGGTRSPTMGVIDMPGMMGLSTPSSRRKIQNAEWNRPSYNYQRTKKAENDEMTEIATKDNLGLVVGSLLVLFGGTYMLKTLETSYDSSGLFGSGGNPTP